MNLPDHSDIPDHDHDYLSERAEIKPTHEHIEHLLSGFNDSDELEPIEQDCPEKWFALLCIGLAFFTLMFVVLVLPYLWH